MSARVFIVSALAVWVGCAQAQAPPPMFSPGYGEALRRTLKMEPADAANLEAALVSNPEDLTARLRLMAYHQRGDRAGLAEDRAKRIRHALWLIEHHPESEILHSPVSRFAKGELTAAQESRATALWSAAATSRPHDAAVQWNAASFFEGLDGDLHLRYLEATAGADANHPFALRPLAHRYALAILNGGSLAGRARASLEASKNVWVLGNAAYMLQSQYNQTVQAGRPNARAAELAERYFLQAKAIDPNLDRKAILPQVDLAAVKRAWQEDEAARQQWQPRAEDAVKRIERVPVEAFPQLPAAVASVLRTRKCRVPQPAGDGRPRNVIRGAFVTAGEEGWAVLCSVEQRTSLLVFRDGRDTQPQTVSVSEDGSYLQGLGGDKIGYWRGIGAVNRDYIMQHYRSYGGPQPPPIDHQGIDDAFLGKASVTWYFHEGKWLRLQGAD